MSRSERPAVPTEGAKLLRAVRGEGKARLPLKALAYDLGVSIERVRQIEAGVGGMTLALAARIEDRFGIPMRAWLQTQAWVENRESQTTGKERKVSA